MTDDVRLSRYATVPPLPCPKELISQFRETAGEPREIQRVFARNKSGTAAIVGTTWHSGQACLGSVNRSSCWVQRKPLIAYWKTADDLAIVFHVRFLHDGKDFASMGIRTTQKGSRALCLFESVRKRGDWHHTLDRPADGVFQARDFRVRFELRGVGATAKPLDGGRFELAADGHRIVIHTMSGHFVDGDVLWEIGEDGRSLEGICYRGERRSFDFSSRLDVALCVGVELLQSDEAVADHAPRLTNPQAGGVAATWAISGGDVLRVGTSGK